MPHFFVDERSCKADGICGDVCPVGIIELREGKRVPTPTEDADRLCIGCGHCVAVCPHGAMSLDSMAPEDCPPLHRELILSPNGAEHFFRSRRSIRVYRDEPVEKSTISRLIEAARYAPSAHNSQPVEWLVVHSAGEVRAMAGLVVDWMREVCRQEPARGRAMLLERVIAAWDAGRDTVCRGAPHAVIAYGDEGSPVAPSSCTIALAYLELAAPSFGLGACWAGYLQAASNQYPPLKEALGLPAGKAPQGAVILGVPRYRYKRLPLRKEPPVTWR
jgi:nitroreductase/NAD-dependent dihydropyrimidine dehydrogenase PreA subunit